MVKSGDVEILTGDTNIPNSLHHDEVVSCSPESITLPIVRPEAVKDKTSGIATYMASILNVPTMICVSAFWVVWSAEDVRESNHRSGAQDKNQPQGLCQTAPDVTVT